MRVYESLRVFFIPESITEARACIFHVKQSGLEKYNSRYSITLLNRGAVIYQPPCFIFLDVSLLYLIPKLALVVYVSPAAL